MFLFVHVFSSGGGANQRKLKQRRMAKRLQRERMKPFVRGLGAGALTKAHCLDEAEKIGAQYKQGPKSVGSVRGLSLALGVSWHEWWIG